MADYQSLIREFESEQIKIFAGSVDPVEKARETVEKLQIAFPVGYGMNAEEISNITGAFYEKERRFLHATGFLLRPDKRISVACYSTGAIGRLTARDVLNLVRFYKSKR